MITDLQRKERLSAEDRRLQLIDVAIDLFSRKGFGGTTTKEIAAAAGVNEAIIFRHFATKQHLYEAILDRRLQDDGTQERLATLTLLMDKKDDRGVFGWLMQAVMCWSRQDTRFERLMLYAALEGHEIAVMHQNMVKPFLETIVSYVASRQKEGALIDCEPKLLIGMAGGAAKQYFMAKYLFGRTLSTGSDESVAETLTGILMNGIAKRGKKK